MNETEKVTFLQQIFDNINNWLHFVEAKNAALIAFDIAFIGAIVDSSLLQCYIWIGSILIVGLSISGLLALYSFKPVKKASKKFMVKDIETNLLYYAYIACLDWNEYVQALYEEYWDESCNDMNQVSARERDYCKEIVENSRIAMRKQNLFEKSLYIVVCMMLLFILLILYA